MIGTQVVWDQRCTSYDFGPGHPMHPSRLALTHRLAEELGLLEPPEVQVVRHPSADDELLHTVHDPDYVQVVRRLSADPRTADGSYGLGTEDTPAFAGMHEASALAVGGSVGAARAVWRGDARHGVNIAGGLHHAMPRRASGFCIYNDAAAAIAAVLTEGAERVVYVDLDVHHGDGVERVFWDDPRVLTISLHETGQLLFPGTGFPGDRGGPRAPDSALNVALPAGTGDRGWLRAFHAVVPAAVRAFRPQLVVSQHGCDGHVADPLAHLALSVDAMQAAMVGVHDLAHEVAGGRWLALGGGGYELVDVVPRVWAHLVGVAGHRPVGLTEPVPQSWLDYVTRVYGRRGPARMGDRGGAPVEYGRWDDGHDPDDEVDVAVQASRSAVFPGLGLDPWFD
ncbi:acetoin utilization protein AcuC [Ornithinicoccus halotolerans]|uniref:acetoin utilization protein AcuC n=1 Tax=Ornithinicoccus halotolerans TaxID=1748220 RepID=UPI001296EB15|nr:acetoin utilization protein AcuC [Ornithinicoccus halotolerans]